MSRDMILVDMKDCLFEMLLGQCFSNFLSMGRDTLRKLYDALSVDSIDSKSKYFHTCRSSATLEGILTHSLRNTVLGIQRGKKHEK